MVYPFPNDTIRSVVDAGRVKAMLAVELSAGQMIEDVKLAAECRVPVHLFNRMGGNVPGCEEVCEAARALWKEIRK